jgi:hypothetical protein
MVLIFFVVWGCIGWGIVCYCAIKAGARRHAMESDPSASHNRQSMQCCAVCGYPLGSKNQCINGGCRDCA